MKRKLFTLSLMTLLTACGGGGGSSNEAPRTVNKPNSPAQTAQQTTEQKKQDQNVPNSQAGQQGQTPPLVSDPAKPNNSAAQTKPENSEKFDDNLPESMKENGNPLALTIDIYKDTNKDYNDPTYELYEKKTITLSGKNEITEEYYSFIPIGDFQQGYIGYYLVATADGHGLEPKYVLAADKAALVTPNNNFTAEFKGENKFIYSPTNKDAITNNIRKEGDISLTVDNGTITGKVETSSGNTDTLFTVNGNLTGGLTFRPIVGKDPNITEDGYSTLKFIGKDNQPKYATGVISGGFNGVWYVKKTR